MSIQPHELAAVDHATWADPACRSAPDHEDDETLVRRLAEGKLDALGALFDRHRTDVANYLLRLGLASSDVDDVVQLTFLDLAKASPRFDGRTAARSWIFGIATMVVRRHRRSMRRWITCLAGRVFEARRAPPRDPHDELQRCEDETRFRRALDAISEKKREAFVLVTMEGLSGEEAAAALGIPVATVWTRLHHARLALRAHLEEDP